MITLGGVLLIVGIVYLAWFQDKVIAPWLRERAMNKAAGIDLRELRKWKSYCHVCEDMDVKPPDFKKYREDCALYRTRGIDPDKRWMPPLPLQ